MAQKHPHGSWEKQMAGLGTRPTTSGEGDLRRSTEEISGSFQVKMGYLKTNDIQPVSGEEAVLTFISPLGTVNHLYGSLKKISVSIMERMEYDWVKGNKIIFWKSLIRKEKRQLMVSRQEDRRHKDTARNRKS